MELGAVVGDVHHKAFVAHLWEQFFEFGLFVTGDP